MDGVTIVKAIVKWLHLSAAMIWLGAIFMSPLMMIRLLQDESESVKIRFQKNYYRNLSPIAWAALGILGVTGIYRAYNHLDNGLVDLINTGWGQLLVLKFGIVLLMIVAGAYRTFRILPALQSAKNPTASKRLSQAMQNNTVISSVLGFVLLWIITLL